MPSSSAIAPAAGKRVETFIKSNSSQLANDDASTPAQSSQHGQDIGDNILDGLAGIREQDRLLPIANVARIMKQAVPTNAKIAKDAKDTVQECVSEFISFVTSEAAERCTAEKRKTITGEDIVWAMDQLGFDQYAHLMKIYLHRYREATKTDAGQPMVDASEATPPMLARQLSALTYEEFPSNGDN